VQGTLFQRGVFNAYWHLGMDDMNDSQQSGDNFYIGQNIGGDDPYLWFDEDEVIGMFTNSPDIDYRLTISGNSLSYYGYYTLSDVSLKNNVTRIESALDKLSLIRGVTYKYNNEFAALNDFESLDQQNKTYTDSAGVVIDQDIEKTANQFSENQYGVIAQEVMQQFPDLVHKGSNGYYAVNYNGLIPVLIEAIKEQQAIIEDIQSELDDLSRSEIKSLSTSIVDEVSSDTPILYQNSPNPFTQNTRI
jgi:hypothetical protein